MCCRRGEEAGQLGAPNCNLQLDFQTGPAPAGSWKSGKSVIKEGMEKQGMLVLHIRLATHPFAISTFPFLVSFLSQTFIILFLEITCMCVGMCMSTGAHGGYGIPRSQSQREMWGTLCGCWGLSSGQYTEYTVYSIQSSTHSERQSHCSSPWLSPMQFPAEIKPFYRTFPFWWYLNWNMVCMGLPDEMQDTCWDLADAHRIVGNLKKTFTPWNYPLLMNLDGLTLATLGVRPFLFILCNSTCAHAAKQELQTSDAGRWVTCRNRITTNCPAGDCTLEFFSKCPVEGS